jgi:hypothetical protein
MIFHNQHISFAKLARCFAHKGILAILEANSQPRFPLAAK